MTDPIDGAIHDIEDRRTDVLFKAQDPDMLTLIGHYPDGRPIWLMAGGDGDESADGTADDAEASGDAKPKAKPKAAATPAANSGAASDAAAPVDVASLTRERDLAKRDLGKLQKEVEDLRTKVATSEDAEKTEIQRLQDRTAAAEALTTAAEGRAQRKALELAAYREASSLGFRRPDKALKEIDMDAVVFDAGEPSNVRSLLEAALKDDEGLKAQAPAPGDAGQGNRGEATLTLEQIRKMSVDEIRARKTEVDKVMAASAGR